MEKTTYIYSSCSENVRYELFFMCHKILIENSGLEVVRIPLILVAVSNGWGCHFQFVLDRMVLLFKKRVE